MTRIQSREQIKQIGTESREKKQGNLQYKKDGWMAGPRCPPAPRKSCQKLLPISVCRCWAAPGCPTPPPTSAWGGEAGSAVPPAAARRTGYFATGQPSHLPSINELPYYIRTSFPVSLSVLSPLTRPLEVSMTSCSTWSGCRSRLAATDIQQTASQQTPAYRIITACRSSATS